MKTKLLFLLCLPLISAGQNQPRQKTASNALNLASLKTELQKEVEIRNPNEPLFTNPNSSATFAEVYKKVFSTVVLGKTDIIANGSAFSYAQDNNKSTFSINGATNFKKFENTIFDGGITLKTKDNSYSYYQKGKWSNDITIKLGVSLKLSGKKMYFNKEGAVEANRSRAAYFDKEYQKYAQILNSNSQITSDTTQLNILAKELRNTAALFQKINAAYSKTDDATKPYHGYRILWANLNISYTNASFAVVNDSVMVDEIQEKFNSVSKFTVEGNLNFHLKGINNFFISQVYGRFNRSSILDDSNLIDKKIKVSPTPINGDYSLYYYDTDIQLPVHFGNYADIHAPVLTVDYGLYFAFLKPFDQQLGLNTRLNFNIPFENNDLNYGKRYSLLLGPIIRLAKDKLFSAVTFTVNTGFENVKHDENAFDKFIVKVSAAIPFNVFEKSK